MQEVALVCAKCKRPFQKNRREHDRQLRKGRKEFFCTLRCFAEHSNAANPRSGKPPAYSYPQADELINFRWFVNRARHRTKRNPSWDSVDITAQDLKTLWESQSGKCPLTGWEMILPPNGTTGFIETKPENASLDRLDNSKGYVLSNVRFISLMANLARSRFSDTDVRRFAAAIAGL